MDGWLTGCEGLKAEEEALEIGAVKPPRFSPTIRRTTVLTPSTPSTEIDKDFCDCILDFLSRLRYRDQFCQYGGPSQQTSSQD